MCNCQLKNVQSSVIKDPQGRKGRKGKDRTGGRERKVERSASRGHSHTEFRDKVTENSQDNQNHLVNLLLLLCLFLFWCVLAPVRLFLLPSINFRGPQVGICLASVSLLSAIPRAVHMQASSTVLALSGLGPQSSNSPQPLVHSKVCINTED